ncbi:hypothetical protein HXX76_000762 [Chlamydomonas incerta]|uniref:Formamidopyrimidine-DNA glycosylase catalytic domain-containing protein n=1 Tax=Chlamydomonas incerta TaxID=51695 RepID=A0A836B3B0_CHLIN|nr:hypothetical protein HXX76_000762 [Chlamydomonas incerta]|eukprot:KAG2446168.1 hypothetical protein HXX76_000762 [Chlamydomonas incerta]
MPELPEVEAARGLVELGCKGKRILVARVAEDEKVISGCTSDELRTALEGRTLVRAHRKGKYMWLELDNGSKGPWVMLHFGMTGGIVVKGVGVTKYKRAHLESDPETWPPRFTKLELELEGGGQLAYVDSRRFGRIKLLQGADPLACEPLCRLGWDVLLQLPPTAAEFGQVLRGRVARAPALRIKALLLDQEFCSGIGNWVADEVLYQARIHPEQTAASLDDAALAALHAAIREVVGLAVRVEADSAHFPADWLFHYRWTNKKASKDASGRDIHFVAVGSRTSAFVPAVQKLKSAGASRAKAAAGEEAAEGGAAAKRKRPTKKAVEEAAGGEAGAGEAPAVLSAPSSRRSSRASAAAGGAADLGLQHVDSDEDGGIGDGDGEEEEEEEEEEAAKPAAKRRKAASGGSVAAAKPTRGKAAGKPTAVAKPAAAAKPARGKAAAATAAKSGGNSAAAVKPAPGAGRRTAKPAAEEEPDEEEEDELDEGAEEVKARKAKAAARPKQAGSQRATRVKAGTAKAQTAARKAGGRATGGPKVAAAAAAAAPAPRKGRAKK